MEFSQGRGQSLGLQLNVTVYCHFRKIGNGTAKGEVALSQTFSLPVFDHFQRQERPGNKARVQNQNCGVLHFMIV